ncbi:S8 family serine peptidase [Halovenus marina]|uniref:S8 family serine peptidase n=1 Tax=Halovenus marina TaxID=3396621 RepID=UPI003F561266
MDDGFDHTRRTFLKTASTFISLTGVGAVTGHTEQPAIDPSLREERGRTTAVLRLTDAPRISEVPRRAATRALQSHAESTQQALIEAVKRRDGIEITRRFWLANAVLTTVDVDSIALAELTDLPSVQRVHGTDLEPSGSFSGSDTTANRPPQASDESDEDGSWALDLVNIPAVWERYGTCGGGSRIAILDTGVDPDHPDIDLGGWAAFDEQGQRRDTEPNDPQGHGTGMASLATGGDASGRPIGAAPDAELYVAGFGRRYNFPAVVAGLEWAVENDADVASISTTMEGRWVDIIEPVENAVAAGTLPITAVEYDLPFLFNATTPEMLVTGAVNENRRPRKDTNGGEVRWNRALHGVDLPTAWPDRSFVPDVTLAGVDVLSADGRPDTPDADWTRASGVSNAPPVAAGIVALLQSVAPERLTPAQLRDTIRETARQPPGSNRRVPNDQYAHGIPDAARAVHRHAETGRTISGVVTDDGGSPVDGATVSAESGAETTTGADGSYTLSVPSGPETLTASAVGYESVETMANGEGADLRFENQVVPDIERVDREPTHIGPREHLRLEFAVEHVDGARVTVEGEGRRVGADAFDLTINGTETAVGQETGLPESPDRLQIELTPHENARGVVDLDIEVARLRDEPVISGVELDPIHIHARPLTVSDDEDLPQALEAAAPETRVELAGEEWTVEPAQFEFPFGDSLLEFPVTAPVLEQAREDEAALVVDRPLTLTAASGYDPTITVRVDDPSGRRVALRVAASYVTVSDIEIEAGGILAGVSILNGVAVHVENVTVSDARHGILGELTMSPRLLSNELDATEVGIRLSWICWNALVSDNDVTGATDGLALDSGLFIDRVTIEQNRFRDVGTELVTAGDGPLSYDRESGAEGQTDNGGESDSSAADGNATDETDSPETGDGTGETDSSAEERDDQTQAPDGSDGSGPGFGVPASLAGLAGAGYIAHRLSGGDD